DAALGPQVGRQPHLGEHAAVEVKRQTLDGASAEVGAGDDAVAGDATERLRDHEASPVRVVRHGRILEESARIVQGRWLAPRVPKTPPGAILLSLLREDSPGWSAAQPGGRGRWASIL